MSKYNKMMLASSRLIDRMIAAYKNSNTNLEPEEFYRKEFKLEYEMVIAVMQFSAYMEGAFSSEDMRNVPHTVH